MVFGPGTGPTVGRRNAQGPFHRRRSGTSTSWSTHPAQPWRGSSTFLLRYLHFSHILPAQPLWSPVAVHGHHRRPTQWPRQHRGQSNAHLWPFAQSFARLQAPPFLRVQILLPPGSSATRLTVKREASPSTCCCHPATSGGLNPLQLSDHKKPDCGAATPFHTILGGQKVSNTPILCPLDVFTVKMIWQSMAWNGDPFWDNHAKRWLAIPLHL